MDRGEYWTMDTLKRELAAKDAELLPLRAELSALSASHKDLAHRLARMGEELEKAREERDDNKWCKSKLIGMRAERDSARALLREAKELCESVRMIALPVGAHAESLRARIAKELGPTHEDEPMTGMDWTTDAEHTLDDAIAALLSNPALKRVYVKHAVFKHSYIVGLEHQGMKKSNPIIELEVIHEDEPHSPAKDNGERR